MNGLPPFYFLEEHLQILEDTIRRYQDDLNHHGKSLGESCRQSAETTHDNFPYEQSVKDHATANGFLTSYLAIKYNSILIEPSSQSEKVEIGNWVSLKDANGNIDRFRIGSYRCFTDTGDDTISYCSPLGLALMGQEVGASITLNKKISYTLVKIESGIASKAGE